MYEVYMKNIQGFRNEFTFHIVKGINEITALHNGTGKTTFFEALKVLVDNKYLSSRNIKYILNLREEECEFRLTLTECIYGFTYTRSSKKLLYYREYLFEGEERTYQNEPFDTVRYDVSVYESDGLFVNILDSKSSLFSSQNLNDNLRVFHQIFNTHKFDAKIEKVGEYYNDINKIYRDLKQQYNVSLNELERLGTEEDVSHYESLYSMKGLEDYNQLVSLEDTLRFISPTKKLPNKQNDITLLGDIYNSSINLNIITKSHNINKTNELQQLIYIYENLDDINIIENKKFNTEDLNNLNSLTYINELLSNLNEIRTVNYNTDNLESLLTITNLLHNVKDNIIATSENKKICVEYKPLIKQYKLDCKHCDKAYLIEGRCIHIDK